MSDQTPTHELPPAALFYHQLSPLPPEALAVIGGMWADDYRRGEQRRREGRG
jgi:hypothetical protein